MQLEQLILAKRIEKTIRLLEAQNRLLVEARERKDEKLENDWARVRDTTRIRLRQLMIEAGAYPKGTTNEH